MRISLTRTLLVGVLLVPFAGCGHFKSKTIGKFDRVHAPQQLLTAVSRSSKPTAEDKQELKLAIASSLEKRGEIRQAKAIYTELASHDQPCVEALHRLAVVHEKEGDAEIAKEYFERAVAVQADNPELISDFGYSHYLHGDLETAERHLRHAIALDPQMRRAHNTLGMLLARTGRESEAVLSFRRGGCNATSAQLNLAFAHSVEGNLELAEETYRTVQKVDPSSEPAHRGLASIRHLTERLAAAPERRKVSLGNKANGRITSPVIPATWTAAAGELELVTHHEDVSDPVADWETGIRDFGFLEQTQ